MSSRATCIPVTGPMPLVSPSPLRNAKLAIPSTHPYGVNATAIHTPRANLLACRHFKTVMSTSQDESHNQD